MNKRASILIGALLLLVSGAVLADNVLKQKVSWSPETLNLPSLKPGESIIKTVTLMNSSILANQKINGEHLTFQTTSGAGTTITATATFPKKLEPGQEVNVTLTFSVASSTLGLPPRVIAGKVQLVKNENEKKLFEKPLLVNIAVSSIPLSPFPDKAEDAKTILGLDADTNGVPDRLEWFIATNAPDSEKKRMAMMLSAKAQQDFFKDFLAHLGEDPNDAGVIARVRALADVRGKTLFCGHFIFGGDAVRKNSREIEALFMDTPERIRAFWKSEKPLVATGGLIPEPEQYKQECLDLGFNPDSLPN